MEFLLLRLFLVSIINDNVQQLFVGGKNAAAQVVGVVLVAVVVKMWKLALE
jgi:hypothetical protein